MTDYELDVAQVVLAVCTDLAAYLFDMHPAIALNFVTTFQEVLL